MIDLRRTLFENNITQKQIADVFGVTRQRVWHWVNVKLPHTWELLLKQYFDMSGIKIYKSK